MFKIYLSFFGLFIMFLGCQTEKTTTMDEDRSLNDLLPSTMVSEIKSKEFNVDIPFYFERKDEDLRIENVIFEMHFKGDQTMKFKSNKDGIIKITLSPGLLKENPKVTVSHGEIESDKIEVKVGGKTMIIKDDVATEGFLDFKWLSFEEKDKFRLYFKEEDKDKFNLERELKEFENIYFLIDSILDVNKFKTFPVLVSENVSTTVGQPDSIFLLPIPCGNQAFKYWVLPHEVGEVSLMSTEFYEVNPGLRWISSGIGEFVAYVVADKTGSSVKIISSRLNELEEIEKKIYSLWEWKAPYAQDESFTPGYGLSLAYWIKIVEEFGLSDFQKFVNNYKELKDQDTKTVKELLKSHFPGKESYGKISLEEAKSILEDAKKKSN